MGICIKSKYGVYQTIYYVIEPNLLLHLKIYIIMNVVISLSKNRSNEIFISAVSLMSNTFGIRNKKVALHDVIDQTF